MKIPHILCLLFLWSFSVFSQNLDSQLDNLQSQLSQAQAQVQNIESQIEQVKFQQIQHDLQAVGLPLLPNENLIQHSAMALVYSEAHEQAKWVAHIITPDIMQGQAHRSNDFRPDPKVATGTAVEADYFLKYLQADSTYKYDGFGFDRGHLAPSADFRWSAKALSESYFYSNIAPQREAFNRAIWASLESNLRAYIYRNPNTQLIILTGAVLKPDLPTIDRSINKPSIPKLFWKVALDLKNQKAIGFILPNKQLDYPLESFAVSIDKVEAETDLDFFHLLPDMQENNIEAQIDKAHWFPEVAAGDVEPLYPPSLPQYHFNTVQAKNKIGQKVTVCGKVVSSKRPRSGNILMNLDKQFPNQIFTLFIRKEDIINFPYQPDKYFINQVVCAKGNVFKIGATPTMSVEKAESLYFYTAND